MTSFVSDDGIELRPEDAPREWVAFEREARFQARMREGLSATIELFPREAIASNGRAFTRCGGLCEEADDCDDLAIAMVTDQFGIDTERRALCEVHFSMYLSDELPLLDAWEKAFHQLG